MVLLLLAASGAAAPALPPPRARATARASITILQPHRASAETWNPRTRPAQRETVRTGADGRPVRLRLTEFE